MTREEALAALGLPANTKDAEKVKRAYRKRALRDHPDRGGDPAAFARVQEAYDSLTGKETGPVPPDPTEVAARDLLLDALRVVLVRAAEAGKPPNTVDLVKLLGLALDDLRDAHTAELKKLAKVSEAFGRAAGRFSAEGGDDVLSGMLEFHRDQITKAAAAHEQGLKAVARAREVLKRHRYQFDAMLTGPRKQTGTLFGMPVYPIKATWA